MYRQKKMLGEKWIEYLFHYFLVFEMTFLSFSRKTYLLITRKIWHKTITVCKYAVRKEHFPSWNSILSVDWWYSLSQPERKCLHLVVSFFVLEIIMIFLDCEVFIFLEFYIHHDFFYCSVRELGAFVYLLSEICGDEHVRF